MNSYFVLAFLAVAVAASDPIVFEQDENRLILSANWLSDISVLDGYFPQYNSALSNRKIKNLSLSFAYCKDPEYILKHFFSQSLQVEVLSVNLDTCKVGDKGISQILSHIDPDQIKELHLILSSSGVSQRVGGLIGKRTAQFGKLKALKIGLMMVKIGDKGLADLFMNPLGLNIEELSLDLTSCKLGNEAFQNFSTFVSNIDPEKLKKVDIIVRGNRLEANSTMDIAKSLKRFVFLQNFKFDAYFNRLKSKGVKPISLLVKRLSKLKVLCLDFDLNYIETEGGKLIGEAIKELSMLQYLQVGVSTKNFGYNGYNHILKGMMNLVNLKYLSFRCGVNRIGTKAALDFKELFSKLNLLQYLELNLVENLMYDEGLTILSQSIGMLQHLRTLKLNFGFNEIKTEGIFSLLKMVNQNNISNLWIGLSNNPLEDSQIIKTLPFLDKILHKCSKFQFELLYTKISEDLMETLNSMFSKVQKEQTCNAVLYVNNAEDIKRTKEEIERQDEQERQENFRSQQL